MQTNFDAQVDASKLFGDDGLVDPGTGEGIKLAAYSVPTEKTPRGIPGFRWDPESYNHLLLALYLGKPLAFVGEAGEGKTGFVTTLASRLNWRLNVVSCHEEMEVVDLLGQYIPRPEGGMDYELSAFSNAVKHGEQILLEEVNNLRPGVVTTLNALLEGHAITIPQTGEVLRPHPDCRVFATANTAMAADVSGRYGSAQAGDAAGAARFVWCRVDPLSREDRDAIVAAYLSDPDQRSVVLDFVDDIKASEIDVPYGTRDLDAWARATKVCGNVALAFRATFANRVPDPADRYVLEDLFFQRFGVALTSKPAGRNSAA